MDLKYFENLRQKNVESHKIAHIRGFLKCNFISLSIIIEFFLERANKGEKFGYGKSMFVLYFCHSTKARKSRTQCRFISLVLVRIVD